jgi:hypothetical protein
VRLCQNKARAAPLPLFLSSVPSAHGFYEKLRFVDAMRSDIDLSGWDLNMEVLGCIGYKEFLHVDRL